MDHTTTIDNYQSLYRFLLVLDEEQVYKLHKVAAGMLNVNVFSSAEIEQLQRRLSVSSLKSPYTQLLQN